MKHFTEKRSHYSTLQVDHRANQLDLKRAYRTLVKKFHPDCNHQIGNHDDIAAINVAYEILSNPQTRSSYDRSIGLDRTRPFGSEARPETRRKPYSSYVDEDRKLSIWIKQVYDPVLNSLSAIMDVLDEKIDDLAADPFDDELMDNFQAYLEECQSSYAKAQILFRHHPNPRSAAGIAAYLYHCLNHLGDGIEELNYFTLNFDDRHLHTGQELWRIADEMRECAETAMSNLLNWLDLQADLKPDSIDT